MSCTAVSSCNLFSGSFFPDAVRPNNEFHFSVHSVGKTREGFVPSSCQYQCIQPVCEKSDIIRKQLCDLIDAFLPELLHAVLKPAGSVQKLIRAVGELFGSVGKILRAVIQFLRVAFQLAESVGELFGTVIQFPGAFFQITGTSGQCSSSVGEFLQAAA